MAEKNILKKEGKIILNKLNSKQKLLLKCMIFTLPFLILSSSYLFILLR